MRIVVTGSAGFIGYHIARRLLDDGNHVVGIDHFSAYYDPALKEKRAGLLSVSGRFRQYRFDLQDKNALSDCLKEARPDMVIHLAAQAGVRYSMEAPQSYINSNIIGFHTLLECLRDRPVAHLLAASTSSVYGASARLPAGETANIAAPVSIYAASKAAGELLGYSYSHLFAVPITFMRFFTVYGPWGRPDMALFKFTRAITADQPVDIYDHGKARRDFTYVGDLTEAVCRLMPLIPADNPPLRTVNIGSGTPRSVLDLLGALEACLGRRAKRRLLPMQPGDVPATHANIALLRALTGYRPATHLETGVRAFVDWYQSCYGTGMSGSKRSIPS